MKLTNWVAALILFAICVINPNYSWSAVTAIAQLTNPNGVVVDNIGGVYVQSLSANSDGGLYKFDSNGNVLAFNNQISGKFHFAFDPSGWLWAQEIGGKLYFINRFTLQAQQFLDLRTWAMANSPLPAVDLLTGKAGNLGMNSPNFGDIAVRQGANGQFDMFITGLSSSGGGLPFVLRLRFLNNALQSIYLMTTSIPVPSIAVPPPLDANPYGLAVNSNGTVLTVMPDNVSGGISPLYLTAFGADFPETGNLPPAFVSAFHTWQAFSTGIAASSKSNGGFYAATVANGFGCGGGAGAAIFYFDASLTFNQSACLVNIAGNMSPVDVALDPTEQILYFTTTDSTVPEKGYLWRYDVALPMLLSVSLAGNGAGVVTSNPSSINCGAVCSANAASGTVFSLTATPSSGSDFVGWGGACSGTGVCNLTLTAATNVTANFAARANVLLSINRSGSGTGVITSNPSGINCGTVCSANAASGTVVSLTATPDSGSDFVGWGGACSGTGVCNLTLTAATNVTANFAARANVLLSINRSGSGTGVITSNPSGINCGTVCSANGNSGIAVTLTATPDSGSDFVGWGGACSGTGVCNLTLTAATNVTANFAARQTPIAKIECFFNVAEMAFPSELAPAGSSTGMWGIYAYRYYVRSNAYVAVSSVDNHLYFYKVADGAMRDLGAMPGWLSMAGCQ